MKNYTYALNVQAIRKTDLYDMKDLSRKITRSTFLKKTKSEDRSNVERELGYASHYTKGLTINQDPFAKYYKSVFNGQPCVYIENIVHGVHNVSVFIEDDCTVYDKELVTAIREVAKYVATFNKSASMTARLLRIRKMKYTGYDLMYVLVYIQNYTDAFKDNPKPVIKDLELIFEYLDVA
jgi:hypothetical protein